MSPSMTKHYLVRGRVQGVFYRASTRTAALALGLSGWVRNCADGAVEVEATGSPAALDSLEAWLWKGPPAADVVELTVEDRDPIDYSGFEIRR
jgi:acylphosphatase